MSKPFIKFHAFVEAMAKGKHNLEVPGSGGDTLKLALCNASNAPASTDSIYSDLTVIDMTNIDSNTLVISTSAQTSGKFILKCNNKTMTATGGAVPTFRYIVIYNDSATNKDLIGYYDYGENVTLEENHIFTVQFDQTNGVINNE